MEIDLSLANRQPAFLGCYTHDDAGVVQPYASSATDLSNRAALTLHLWRSVAGLADQPDTLAISQKGKMSVYLARGGLIIEGKDRLNLGLLKSMVRSIDTVSKLPSDPLQPSGRAARAVLKLAQWIERIEAGRMIELIAGDAHMRIWAQKGRFDPIEQDGPLQVARAIYQAVAAEAPVKLRYIDPGEDRAIPHHPPEALLAETSADAEWSFDADGRLMTRPPEADLTKVASVIALTEAFETWREDKSAELAVLQAQGTPSLRLSTTASNSISLSFL